MAPNPMKQLLEDNLENSRAVIFMKDQNGNLVFVNDAFTKLFGLSREEVIGKSDKEFQPEDLVEVYRTNDQKVRDSQKAITFKELVNIQGQTRTFISHKFPVNNIPEYPNAVAGVCIEVSDLV